MIHMTPATAAAFLHRERDADDEFRDDVPTTVGPAAAEYGDYGECYLPGYTCPIHDERVVMRYARLLRRAWKRGWRPEEARAT